LSQRLAGEEIRATKSPANHLIALAGACLAQGGTANSVPEWIDALVLNPED